MIVWGLGVHMEKAFITYISVS